MIIRRWHALADDERPYLSHFRRQVLPALREIDGFEGTLVLRRFARQVQHFELMLEVRPIRRQTRSEERRSNAQKGKRDG
jgi:hypothetical protein